MATAESVRQAALGLFARYGYRATTMDQIGDVCGVRGPSLYRHVRSKQDLLVEITVGTMRTLIEEQRIAVSAGGTSTRKVRRMVEAHVRFHAGNRDQALVGNREIDSLEEPHRAQVVNLRRRYERGLRSVIMEGIDSGEFAVVEPRLVSYAILDMGMGVSVWFRADGPQDVSQIAYAHSDYAIAMLTGAGVAAAGNRRSS